MCAAYGFIEIQDWLTRYEADNPNNLHPAASYNIRPSKDALVIVRKSPNSGRVMKFGFKAPWNDKLLLINAKAEGIQEKAVWKKMFREQRCLVPVSFYVEWQKLSDMKQPWAFRMKDGKPFAFAGLFTEQNEFVIITCEPVEAFFQGIHPRQPVALRRNDEETWLNPDSSEEQLLSCLVPPPSTVMKKWRISSLVNKAANDFSEILQEAL